MNILQIIDDMISTNELDLLRYKESYKTYVERKNDQLCEWYDGRIMEIQSSIAQLKLLKSFLKKGE